MYRIVITKTRRLSDEERKTHEDLQDDRHRRGNGFGLEPVEPLLHREDEYGNVIEQVLKTTLTDEQFEKVRKATLEAI